MGEYVDDLPLPRKGQRDSMWLVVIEFAMIAGLFVADFKHHIFGATSDWCAPQTGGELLSSEFSAVSAWK
jgi:hypothetical protein